MKTNDIKRVIDAGLADVETSQRDVENIMDYIRESEERKPARKMPLAVAVALVLLLIGAVAFAAMSFLGVIDQIFSIQQVEKNEEISEWSFEHKMEVVNLLSESNVDFNEEMLMQIYSDELTDEEKDAIIVEMLEEFVTVGDNYWGVTTVGILIAEKGMTHTWTHEERAWYGERFGMPMDEAGAHRYVMPTEEDMSEEEAFEIAYQYYYDNYGLTSDCYDMDEQYACFEEVIEEGNVLSRVWHIRLTLSIDEYNGQKINMNDMSISIRNDGSIYWHYGPQVRTYEDDLFDLMFSPTGEFWTIEGMYDFQNNYKPLILQRVSEGESTYRHHRYLAARDFGLPQEGDVPIETVREIARAAVLATDDWTEELIDQYYVREAYELAEPNRYLIVYTLMNKGSEFYDDEVLEAAQALVARNDAGEIPFSIRVSINAKTGEVIDVYQMDRSGSVEENVGY